MNKDSAKTSQSPALRRRRINSSRTQQSPLATEDGKTRPRKRKASPDKKTPKKRKVVSKAEPCNTSEEDVSVKRVKRKVEENGEGPLNEKKRGFDIHLDDKESASSSTDTGREINSSRTQQSPLATEDGKTRPRKRKASPDKETQEKRKMVSKAEPCNTSEEDASVKRGKRKVKEYGEGPLQKKKRGFDLHLDDKESASSSTDTGREINSSRTQQSPLATEDGKTRPRKRKASPDKETQKKRKMVSKAEPCNTSEEDASVKRGKRKVKEYGEGPLQKKKRGFDLHLDDKESASSSTDTGREINSSRTQQSPLATEDGKTRPRKRKASPDKETQEKRKMVSKAEPCNTSEEDASVKRGKRKVKEYGEGPLQKKKRGFDLHLDDKESASSSMDTGRESSSNPLEGCSTSLGMRGVKRKTAANGEGPTRKKKSPDLDESKKETKTSSVAALRAVFEAKYEQGNELGQGGCGSVFAGYRKADNLPVAIKHIPKDKVFCKQVDEKGNKLSVEVAVMLKLGLNGSVGHSAPVSLLDWYDLDKELILVLERPVPSVDLLTYIDVNGGCLKEEEAKIIVKQLLDATIELQNEHIFHRDIKVENILIETGTDIPRVRLIDFGLSCFVKKGSFFRIFYGTSAHIPPEWYSHSTYRAGPTTVWQLGVVLFETLHRCSLFETTRFLDSKLKISNKLSNDCQDFLRLCLTEVPEQRPTLEHLQLHPWLR